MVGLEKNRVFDTHKLEMLRSVGSSLLKIGDEACTSWDSKVSDLIFLKAKVPSEIRSKLLDDALSATKTPFNIWEYDVIRFKLENTLFNLVGTMPIYDSNAASAVKYTTIITNSCTAMIEDLKQYVNIETLSLDYKDYNHTMIAYRAEKEQEYPDLDALSEQAETILKGLPECTSFDGDPVNMETGNFVYRYTDLKSGMTETFTFTRFYNAMDRNKGAMGRGWIHNWEMHLDIQKDKIVLIHEDGREEYFELAEVENEVQEKEYRYLSRQNEQNKLLDIGKYYYLKSAERNVCIFDKSGKFIRLQREDGSGVTLSYERDKLVRIKEDTGMIFYLTYNGKGQLTELEDETGRRISYVYDGKKLTQVKDPEGNTFTYSYAKNGKILQLLDKRGVPVLKNEYDDHKRIILQKFPDGASMKFEYLRNKRVCVTERNGSKIIYTHDEKHRNIETVYEDGKETWSYDERDLCREYTDKKGNKTTYDYNQAGQVICRTDALLNQTKTEYDTEGRPVRQVRADGGIFSWSYDSEGRLVERTDPENYKTTFVYCGKERRPSDIILPDGSRCSLSYDTKGNICAVKYPDGRSMTYRYDALGRVVESCDKSGNSMRFTYDTMNRITKVIRADGLYRAYCYNEMGEVLEVRDFDGYSASWKYNVLNKPEVYIDKCGRKTVMEYDLMWNLSKMTDPEGGVTEYIYNTMNHLETVKEIGGNCVYFTYDPNGNRTEIHYPDGTARYYTYDELNRRTSETDENGNITRTFYDCMGNISRIVDGAGNETLYTYDKNGRKIKETDASGAVICYTYTPLGKPETVTDPAGRVTHYHYDIGGRLKRMGKGDGTWEAYEYDESGNIITRNYQDGQTTTYRYDCMNRVTQIWYGEDMEKMYEYDAMGRVIASTDAAGNCTKYRYSPEGKLIMVIDSEGSQVRYSYNGRDELMSILRLSAEEAAYYDKELADINRLNEIGNAFHMTLITRNQSGRVEKIVGENGKCMCYSYDTMGRVISQRDEEGRNTTFDYYPGGRVKEVCYPDGKNVALSYDTLYHLSCIHDWLGETIFDYDEVGRLTKSTDHRGGTIEYSFNPDGSRKWMCYPDGRMIQYHYDAYGRLSELESGRFKVGYAYNEKGQLSTIERGNGIKSLYHYNGQGRLTELLHQGEEGMVEAFTYQYDVLGNCAEVRRESSQSGCSYQRGYGYDTLGRLVSVYEGAELLHTYTYDAYGNRIRQTESSLLTADLAESTFGCRGELTALWQNGQLLQENIYNGLGYRVGEKKNGFESKEFYIDYTDPCGRVIMETGEKNRHYLWHDNTLLGVAEEENYVLTDILQTPVRVTDREGKGRSCYVYDEFGVPLFEEEGIFLPFGFTGHRKEALPGLYHAGAREYDSRRGRFLTRDQYRYMDYEDPVSLNLYQYAKGNPLRYVDYDGHESIEEPSYERRTLNHVVMGNLTDDVTGLGVVIDILLGLVGIDVLQDIRDLGADLLVNFDPDDKEWRVTTALDAVALFPVVGVAKHFDEAAILIKNASKKTDNVVDVAKYMDDLLDGVYAPLKESRKKSDDLLKDAQEMLEDSQKKLDDVKSAGADAGKGGGKTISQMLKKTTCSNDELYVYLSKQVGSDAAEAFAKNGTWPSEVQIPKNSSALNPDGSMNWSRAPQGGYTLDANGNAIKETFTPKIGEVIDRYGPADGRYTSPVIDGKAFSYSERSLPYVEDVSKYHQYEVTGDFTKIEEYVKNCTNNELKAKIDAAVIAYYDGDYSKLVSYKGKAAGIEGWGKGGATQYEFSLTIEQLEGIGLLKEIK